MPVHFDTIEVGSKWERNDLAQLWGYKTFHAIARGVVTPREGRVIILFVQEEKRGDFAQYENRIGGKRLYWAGVREHLTDHRVANAVRNGDEIHVFYRKLHRDRFTYLGRAELESFEFGDIDPSRAQFFLTDWRDSTRTPWTRAELEVAMNIYCTVPFGQFHARNPLIIEVAALMGRSPSSLAMKLCNFASLDPVHQARGVRGLAGASQADREMWATFQSDWETYAYESERRLAALRGEPMDELTDLAVRELPKEGLEREGFVKQRVNQCFFRSAVLAAYGSRCCLTGLAVPELLVASHIIPWAENRSTRVNPANGLCLNALHDRAFDRGLIAISDDLRVMVSPSVRRYGRSPAIRTALWELDGAEIRTPDRFAPDRGFLEWHRINRFQHAA